jgi:crotonobetainyl-CoA:carnitine CoA-transferase CaiB-like acyl-CoA transferase
LPALYGAGIPTGPINSLEQALKEEHTLARGLIAEYEHPKFGTVKHTVSPVRVGDGPYEYRRAPERGEHFGPIVRDLLGYDAAKVEQFIAKGAFGEHPDASEPA